MTDGMCDCEREGPGFRERGFLELLDSSEYAGGRDGRRRYEHFRCARCGAVWFLTVDADSPDPEKNILSRQRVDPVRTELWNEAGSPGGGCKNSPAGPFLGRWRDGSGRVLAIRTGDDGAILADYADADGAYVMRSLLNFRKSPSRDMPAAMADELLVVELGTPGLGPTLALGLAGDPGRPVLVPRIDMGLYDDWEDDFGVPWALPLSEFAPLDV